jgi:hypothetical protein
MTTHGHESDVFSSSDVLVIDESSFRSLLPTVYAVCDFPQCDIQDATRMSSARRNVQETGQFAQAGGIQAFIEWDPLADAKSCRVRWLAYSFQNEQRQPRPRVQQQLGAALHRLVERQVRRGASDLPPRDPVAYPGFPNEKAYSGTLRDYSGCATLKEAREGLEGGVFSIGRYQFTPDDLDAAPADAPMLSLNKFRNSSLMEYNGILVCAPQNSGKTKLLVRWAAAATHARRPYALFVVDVKGNMRSKLAAEGLRGDVYRFSTDPADVDADRINFLAGPAGFTPEETDRIRQIATALLPSRGVIETGGDTARHYRNSVTWLSTFIHILKLSQHYLPTNYPDDEGNPREVDLADLYELVTDETKVVDWIVYIAEREDLDLADKIQPPGPGIRHWASEIAIMLDPARVAGGQRPEKDRFREYTHPLVAALEPFSAHGTLHRRVRSFVSKDENGHRSTGRLFDLEDVLGGERNGPATIVMAARQQDLDKATTILSLTIKRLQWLLFDRMSEEKEAEGRPILLLLDETRRIPDFDAAEYVSFAREAKATCVIAYQALDQIGPAANVTELLDNVGTQIFLGSLVGNTARHVLGILPTRMRPTVSRQVTPGMTGTMVTTTTTTAETQYFTLAELSALPAGRWPALVYVNDQPRRKPILTSMDEEGRDRNPSTASRADPVRSLETTAPEGRPAVGAAARRQRETLGYKPQGSGE